MSAGGGGTEDDSADDRIAHIPKSLSLSTVAAANADEPDETTLLGTEDDLTNFREADETAGAAAGADDAFDDGDIGSIAGAALLSTTFDFTTAEFDFFLAELAFLSALFDFWSAELKAGGTVKSWSATRRKRAR